VLCSVLEKQGRAGGSPRAGRHLLARGAADGLVGLPAEAVPQETGQWEEAARFWVEKVCLQSSIQDHRSRLASNRALCPGSPWMFGYSVQMQPFSSKASRKPI